MTLRVLVLLTLIWCYTFLLFFVIKRNWFKTHDMVGKWVLALWCSPPQKNPSWPNPCCFCQPGRHQFFQMFCQKEEFITSYLEDCFCAYFPAIVISFGPGSSCEPLLAKLLPQRSACVILWDYEWHLSLIQLLTIECRMSPIRGSRNTGAC